MKQASHFFVPLTVELLERRVPDWRQFLSLVCAGVMLLFGSEIITRNQTGDAGSTNHLLVDGVSVRQLAEYVLVWVGIIVVWHFLHIFLTRVLFSPSWHRFALYPNEVILARKGSELIVIRTTEEIKNRALDGCSDLVLIKTEPWVKRPFECWVGRHKMTFLLSLKVLDPDVETLGKWMNMMESEILREFRIGAKELASQLGIGRALESPHEFAQLLTECLNRRLFSIVAVQIEVSPTAEQEDLHTSAEESLFG